MGDRGLVTSLSITGLKGSGCGQLSCKLVGCNLSFFPIWCCHLYLFFFFFFGDRKRKFIEREENVQKRIRHSQIDTKNCHL